jgi:hypothetical protein
MLPTARSLAEAAKAEGLKVAKKARESADALAAAAAVKEAERKAAERKKKSGKAKKYYAVAVGRSHGIFTDWDEVEGYVNGFSGCVFKAFKSRREAKSWYTKKWRLHHRRRRRRDSSGNDTSSDEGRGSWSRGSKRRHRRSSSGGSSSSGGTAAATITTPPRAKSLTKARQAPSPSAAPTGALRRAPRVRHRRAQLLP